jgi:hypothetical protein
MERSARSLLLVGLMLGCASAAEPTVGMVKELRAVVIPGPLLKAKADPAGKHDLVLRILASYPHGTLEHCYDLSFFTYRTGDFNLCDFLEPAVAGDAAVKLEPITVQKSALLEDWCWASGGSAWA